MTLQPLGRIKLRLLRRRPGKACDKTSAKSVRGQLRHWGVNVGKLSQRVQHPRARVMPFSRTSLNSNSKPISEVLAAE
jgi:hypothetical protein